MPSFAEQEWNISATARLDELEQLHGERLNAV